MHPISIGRIHMPTRIDSFVSHAMGKMKAVKARIGGLHGVFATLAEQHGEVTALIMRCKNHPDRRSDLWPTIRAELLSHERAEMSEVFPELRTHAETRPLADHHDVEAGQLEALIDLIDATDISSDGWGTSFAELADMVGKHAQEEETETFPAAQKVLGDDLVKRLDERFVRAKQRILQSA
jgi:hypothetical protein